MRRIFKKEIGMIVILWTLTATATPLVNSLPSEWLRHFNDENNTGTPAQFKEFEKNLFYPIRKLMQHYLKSENRINRSRQLHRTQINLQNSTKFPCEIQGFRSSTRPTSVHKLKPGDIDVIGGIGDSLTVGTGSFSIRLLELFVEHRGVSWTAGGQGTWREYLTLPNILKVFNPKLLGYALGDSLAEERFSQFNVAENGALAKDMPFMTKELVKRIKMDKRVDIKNDWKIITIFLGSNTFCLDMCYENYKLYPEKHREDVLKSLRIIKENLPRTIVNLVLSPNITSIREFKSLPAHCNLLHIVECPCFYARQFKKYLSDYDKVIENFQKVDREIVEYEEFKNKDDFTVVLQPFTEKIDFPQNQYNVTDLTYLAHDCFHLSQKGYSKGASSLWNNMMEPIGRKTNRWSQELEHFICPTAKSPFIRTWKNSVS